MKTWIGLKIALIQTPHFHYFFKTNSIQFIFVLSRIDLKEKILSFPVFNLLHVL